MDKIDRIRKIISESSAAQEASKERAAADREKQREVLNRIKKRKENNKKYTAISQSIKNAKFSKLRRVSDDGKKGATAVQKAAGNVIKGVGNIAKAGAKVARKGIKATTAVKMSADRGELRTGLGGSKNKLGRTVDKSVSKVKTSTGNMINKIKQRASDKFKAKPGMFRNYKEEFIQEVENKKDKVDKVIDIMRGKNKIEINPDVKESVDKKKI